ncbi:MAG: PIN domain-containing protein [Deltaproteobacteria bacterium]|nr:PIN domain-containing protein [Deltaproteobacteria bacterium]
MVVREDRGRAGQQRRWAFFNSLVRSQSVSRGLFVDTSAWKALVDAKEKSHDRVRREFERCQRERVGLVTTDYVLSETFTLLRLRCSHDVAVQFGDMLFASHVTKVQPITADQFRQAWAVFGRYADKAFSFVDCTSFVVMEQQKLREALALDAHFTQYGFRTRPGK